MPLRDVPAQSRRRKTDDLLSAQDRIIQSLLAHGVDVRANHSRSLYAAADCGQAGLVQLMLEKGADVNARGQTGDNRDQGQTALMAAIASVSGARLELKWHRDGTTSGSNLQELKSEERFAQKTVDLLLAHGASANMADEAGKTPLMCCSANLSDVAERLLQRGARIDAADEDGRTALMRAAVENDPALAEFLLKHKADVNRRDGKGCTALMLAIDDGSNDERRSMDGAMPPGTNAAPGNDPDPQSERNLPNPDGHPALVKLLLRHGADVCIVGKNGMTALKLAQKENFAVVVDLLRKAGAK